MWTLAFGYHEDRAPTHGYAATREDAMTAFPKSWRRKKNKGQLTVLTRAERKLRSEVEEIASFVQMDVVWNFERYAPDLTTWLGIMKDKLVRSHIVAQYTFIDEYLTMIICNYYFYRPKKNIWYRELWKTKRFRVFMHHLMDEMFMPKKLSVVEAIKDVPTSSTEIGLNLQGRWMCHCDLVGTSHWLRQARCAFRPRDPRSH